ncbi:MAG: ATP-binding protein [Flavobacteriales bacterium]|nr:ATP-binding protein [Flavobacteriales bacterium]
MSASPFKFLDSYTRADIGDFFGRDKETDELFRQCFLSPILVVYGGSGTGKTSLVQCGLASRFQDSDWLPVPVRRSGDMIASVREAINAVTLTASNSVDLGQLAVNLYLDHFKPIYFLFDQFEELFIFGGHAESEVFFATMRALLEKERNAHAIFVVREEYLAELTRYERIIPGLIENRYRVERLSHHHAMNVVQQLCGAHGITCTEGFASALVERLDPESHGIELSYLQVFLDRCWRTRQGDEPFSPALLERIGHVDDLLGAFLDEQVADTAEPQRAEALLKTFVSDQGTKRQLTSAEAHEWVNTIGTPMELADVERLLQVFVTKRLLKERDERGRYELLHDALARQIFQRITRAEQELIEVRQFVQQAHGQFVKRGVKLTANDLTYLRPYRNQLHLKGEMKEFVEGAFGEEERRERRKRLRRNISVALLLAVLLGTGAYAWRLNQRLQAEKLVKQSADLAEHSMKALSGDPNTAYLMAERAFEITPTFESEKALVAIYPQLYPELARFKGNGFYHLPFSKVLVIADHANDRVSCYTETGERIWEETVPGLESFSGVSALDSSGLVLLKGQRAIIRDVEGNTLYNADIGDSSRVYVHGRRMALVASGKLVLIDSSSVVTETSLNTRSLHGVLLEQDEFRIDDQFKFIVANDDSTVQIFDLNDPKVSRTALWKAPSLIQRLFHWSKPGECILATHDGLYRLHWGLTGITGLDKIWDLEKLGLPSSSINGVNGVHTEGILVPGVPGQLYDIPSETNYPLAVLRQNQIVLGYDAALKRLLYKQDDGQQQPVFISSFDGRTRIRVVDNCRWDQVQSLKDGTFALIQHQDDQDELVVQMIAYSGDTVATYRMKTSMGGETFNAVGLSMWSSGEYRHNEAPAAYRSARLRSVLDTSGEVLHMLLPASKIGAALYRLPGAGDRMLLTYSDSLVSLISAPWHSPTNALTIAGPQCLVDSSLQSSKIINDRLTVECVQKDMQEEAFTIALNGCLDSIKLSGYNSTGCKALTKGWAWVYKWGRDVTGSTETGYLVDLTTRTVVDTGSFRLPARYEILPNGTGFLRVGGDGLFMVDMEMHSTPIDLSGTPLRKLTQRAGNNLLILDSLSMGFIEVVDLNDLHVRRRSLPNRSLSSSLLKSIDRKAGRAWLDDQDNLFITFSKRNDFRLDSMIVVDSRDSIYLFGMNNRDLQFSWTEHEGLRIKASPIFYRIVNGGGLGSVGAGRFLTYDAEHHTLVDAVPASTPSRVYLDRGGATIERGGQTLWDIGSDQGVVCGKYYYSRFRAVDHYERFPLYGKEVIRLVREEKQFGEFWKHIDAEPLIDKVLGTDAYNTGYQVGSLLRSTWVRLGLLLGVGALGFAWWSRRKRLRMA